ncbi:MAG: hypothetical protein R3248_13080 [Candidatus Promineifilaceae bacterium]|nr:hypothetical protein [Candidatus Promineifilaceae bacterium]
MDYGMIGKIEKAKIYAEERADRIQFETMRVRIDGDNHDHVVTYDTGSWSCDCDFFSTRNVCSHTMAMERVLQNMVQRGETVS